MYTTIVKQMRRFVSFLQAIQKMMERNAFHSIVRLIFTQGVRVAQLLSHKGVFYTTTLNELELHFLRLSKWITILHPGFSVL